MTREKIEEYLAHHVERASIESGPVRVVARHFGASLAPPRHRKRGGIRTRGSP